MLETGHVYTSEYRAEVAPAGLVVQIARAALRFGVRRCRSDIPADLFWLFSEHTATDYFQNNQRFFCLNWLFSKPAAFKE